MCVNLKQKTKKPTKYISWKLNFASVSIQTKPRQVLACCKKKTKKKQTHTQQPIAWTWVVFKIHDRVSLFPAYLGKFLQENRKAVN